MCVCVRVCICECVCARACIWVFVYVCECARMCVCLGVCVRVCVCVLMLRYFNRGFGRYKEGYLVSQDRCCGKADILGYFLRVFFVRSYLACTSSLTPISRMSIQLIGDSDKQVKDHISHVTFGLKKLGAFCVFLVGKWAESSYFVPAHPLFPI